MSLTDTPIPSCPLSCQPKPEAFDGELIPVLEGVGSLSSYSEEDFHFIRDPGRRALLPSKKQVSNSGISVSKVGQGKLGLDGETISEIEPRRQLLAL